MYIVIKGFSGLISGYENQVLDIEDKKIAADLLAAGYIKEYSKKEATNTELQKELEKVKSEKLLLETEVETLKEEKETLETKVAELEDTGLPKKDDESISDDIKNTNNNPANKK